MSPLHPYTRAMETYSILNTGMDTHCDELRTDALLLMDGTPYKGYDALRLVILWGSGKYMLCGTDKRGGLLECVREGDLPFGHGTELVKDIMRYIGRSPYAEHEATSKSAAFIHGWDAYNLMVPIMDSHVVTTLWHDWLKGWTAASKAFHRSLEAREGGWE